jgi:alkylation response protein AidB-like acyl-CoA dehydrogenase
MAEDARFREKLTALEVELKAFEITSLRALDAAAKDPQGTRPDPYSSMLKLKSSEIQQQLDELIVQIAGPNAVPYSAAALSGDGDAEEPEQGDWRTAVPNYAFKRVLTIAGGSSEVQRNVISKAVLGL